MCTHVHATEPRTLATSTLDLLCYLTSFFVLYNNIPLIRDLATMWRFKRETRVQVSNTGHIPDRDHIRPISLPCSFSVSLYPFLHDADSFIAFLAREKTASRRKDCCARGKLTLLDVGERKRKREKKDGKFYEGN